MRLAEFFDLTESDDDVPDKPPKGLSGMFSTGEKPRGPGKVGADALPPTEKQKLWQMTQDFLGKHDPSSRAASMSKRPGQTSTGTIKGPSQGSLHQDEKPKYRGQFVGHTVDLGGQYKRKPVSWTDKDSGERRFGGVQSKQTKKAVWTGKDWVSPEEFASTGGKGI